MKFFLKILIIAVLYMQAGCGNEIIGVEYSPAIPESILTCCGDTIHNPDYWVISVRGVGIAKTKEKRCTEPGNLFYRIIEYEKGCKLNLVCRLGYRMIVLSGVEDE